MKPKTLFWLLAAFMTSCGNPEPVQPEHSGHESTVKKIYTCPMHPDVIRDRPGQCPVCGMNLVEKITGGHGPKDTVNSFLLKPANRFVLSSIRTVKPESKKLPVTLEADGAIAYDPQMIRTVSARVSGQIRKLYVKSAYQPISKGDKLMDIYSKELVTAQENFLFLLKDDPDNHTMIRAAEEKLLFLGLHPGQVQEIRSSRNPINSITLYSEYSGHLHDLAPAIRGSMDKDPEKNSMTILHEGMFVEKGQGILNIYNTGKVWAVLNIHPDQLPLLKTGCRVRLSADGTTDSAEARIDFIEPVLRPGKNTVTVRVHLDNPGGKFRIGANVRARIYSEPVPGLYIPSPAVYHSGLSSVVFIRRGEYFESRAVRTGPERGGWILLLSGLDPGEELAANAQLLMDSESFIKTGLP